MSIKVNRNILWTKIFIEQLASLGVQYACVSPGSRSAPLAYILSKNRRIKSFIHFDERSSAFFALGIAKSTGIPVLIVTTSGTAVAELYPAIIEAYQQRTPLIICTADRPPEMIGTGANQTINQHNIFSNHIRWFRDLGLPSISDVGLYHLQKIAIKAFRISSSEDRGPVHLNFPFRKPLEPFSYTDKVTKKISLIKPQRMNRVIQESTQIKIEKSGVLNKILRELIEYDKGVIIAGPMEYNVNSIKKIKELSSILKYPVFADGISQLRFNINKNDRNIVSNFNSILNSKSFGTDRKPDIILQFGRTPTSSLLENYLKETEVNRFVINTYGDKFDPARNAKNILALGQLHFCEFIISKLKEEKPERNKSNWLKNFFNAEEISEKIKSRIIERAKFPNEVSCISDILKLIPLGSNLIIGNSFPVRDLDNFTSKYSKKVKIYFNRGASGIDGVTSTALGIATKSKPSFLITGDLSFLHDVNSLSLAVKYAIPLNIIVINNNGGGIFESLPIARVRHFEKFFISPHNLDLGKITESFGVNYKLILTRRELQRNIRNSLNKGFPSVFEVQTDATKSVELRKKIFNSIKNNLDKEFISEN